MEFWIVIAALVLGAALGALVVAARLLPAKTRAEAKLAALSEQHQAMGELREQAKVQFEHLATSIMEKNSEKLTKQSQDRLQELLNPLKERFGEFQKKVDESFGTQAKEQFSLKEEIKRIVDTNEKMRLQTDSLTKALKGDSKAQGNWGEVMLERILEDAGLQKGRDYTVQGKGMGLKHADDGSHLKPDCIIHLPDNKHLVIDSKVSLTHYEQYCSAEEGAKPALLKQHLLSIRGHVAGLAQRRYQDSSLGTPDFVLMFMPVEGAYSLAVQNDAQLHAEAWDKRVVIVCPSTLFATMRTVASLWKIEQQNRNAEDIAKRGGALYDKIEGFVKDMLNLQTHLSRATGSFEDAFRKLHVGPGNMLRQAEQLKDMGAKTSKQLPKELLSEDAPALEKASA